LGYFKYANFFVDTAGGLTGCSWHLAAITLPLAISFFTFQQITYLVDAYRGETREYNFLHYCLFVSFFPQLIAGPIVHHREMLPQFANDKIYRPQSLSIAIGCTIFFIGLFKKVVIADSMALHATPIFDAAETGTELSFLQHGKGPLPIHSSSTSISPAIRIWQLAWPESLVSSYPLILPLLIEQRVLSTFGDAGILLYQGSLETICILRWEATAGVEYDDMPTC
jgi:hypothetical protein